jgi:ketosteroid isomerase-like protein
MGEAEMALLREVYSYWEKGDFRPTHFMQPDFELVFGEDFLDAVAYRGLDEVGRGWRTWLDSWSFWAVTTREYVQAGERILVHLDAGGTAKSSGLQLEQPSANLWEFRDGLASRMTLYVRPETALKEAGLTSGGTP